MLQYYTGGAMAQTITRQPVTAEARVFSRASPCLMGNVTLEQVITRILRVVPLKIIPPWLSILIYHLGMNNRPLRGRSSEI
jgi:hypothetical protein